MIEDVRRWLGLERTETVANEQAVKAEATESTKQAETISPAKRETGKLRPELPVKIRANIKLNVPPPGRSRGISH